MKTVGQNKKQKPLLMMKISDGSLFLGKPYFDSNLVAADADSPDDIGLSSCLKEGDKAEKDDTHAQDGVYFSQYISVVRPTIPSSPGSIQRDGLGEADKSNTANECR